MRAVRLIHEGLPFVMVSPFVYYLAHFTVGVVVDIRNFWLLTAGAVLGVVWSCASSALDRESKTYTPSPAAENRDRRSSFWMSMN